MLLLAGDDQPSRTMSHLVVAGCSSRKVCSALRKEPCGGVEAESSGNVRAMADSDGSVPGRVM